MNLSSKIRKLKLVNFKFWRRVRILRSYERKMYQCEVAISEQARTQVEALLLLSRANYFVALFNDNKFWFQFNLPTVMLRKYKSVPSSKKTPFI